MTRNEFSSSTKVLFAFAETEATKKLVNAYGDRLSELTQMEKYQLVTAIGLLMWSLAYDIENNDDRPSDDLVSALEALNEDIELTGNVQACLLILKDEDPDNLSAILSAICEYAREDDRLHT